MTVFKRQDGDGNWEEFDPAEMRIGEFFNEGELDAIAYCVYKVGGEVFQQWVDDPENLELREVANAFRELVHKFLPFSENLQAQMFATFEQLNAMSEEERKEWFDKANPKSSLDEAFAGLEGLFDEK
jgi:hypothetical protein